MRKRDGSILGYSFDSLNRMIVKTVPERANLTAAQTRDVFYSYDLRGLQLSARFDSQAGEGIANAYDGFGRLASSGTDLGGVTRTLTYAHDRNGNRTRITHPDGQWFATDYDALDRPYWLHGTGGGIAQSYFTPAGALADLNRVGSTFTHIGYDALQRPTWRGHFFTGPDNVHFSYSAAWSYAFNPAGQIGSVSRDNDDFAWRRHYAVNRPYATNGLNQYTAAGPANFAYDPNGNLVADGTNTYGYDIENRMVRGPNGATLSYDPLGRLFQVTGPAPLAAVTRFLYDGDALVAEYDGANEMIRRHVHWVGQPAPAEAGVPLASYEGAGFGTLRQLFTDHQGSIVALADTGGHVAAINTYDEYGFPGVTNSGRFQYTGQAWIPELGMYHYKARIYSPALGRFMQTDPVGYEGGINLYGYVGGDPVNLTDPDGRQPAVALAPLCIGPQGAACGVAALGIGAAGCVASSGCRNLVERAMNSPLGQAVSCVMGNCAGPAQAIAGVLLNEGDAQPETNPYNEGRRGVSEPVIVVDSPGNAIPVSPGEHITSSPDGNFEQVRGPDNRQTGVRIDRGGHPGQRDSAARGPHAHRPGVTINGNPHLPIRSNRKCRDKENNC